MQTTYNQFPSPYMLGQQLSAPEDSYIESFPAAEAIPFGSYVEVVSGAVRLPQQSSSSLGSGGVALAKMDMMQTGNGYAQYDMVPVLRKGKVVARWSGTTRVDFGAPNIRHASTNGNGEAANRGEFTDAATSTTAGSEIAAAPEGIKMRLTHDTAELAGAVIVDLNLPA